MVDDNEIATLPVRHTAVWIATADVVIGALL